MKILVVQSNKIICNALKDFIHNSESAFNIDAFCTTNISPAGSWKDYDVIVTDHVTLPTIPKECFDHSKVLILDSGLEKSTIVSLFLTDNIKGIIPYDSEIEILVKAIKVIHKGEVWIDNATVKFLLDRNITKKLKESVRLTERESVVTRLVQEGYRNKEIADLLSISDQTVKSHLNRIFRKMNVSARTELVARIASNS